MLDGHLDHICDSILVDLVHRKSFDPMIPQDLLFPSIDIPKSDIDQSILGQTWLDPAELFDLSCNSQKERDGTAMDVTTVGCLWGVDVLV